MTAGVVVTDQAFGNVTREREVAERFGVPFAEHQTETEDETAVAIEGARVVFNNFAPMTRRVLGVLQPGAVVIRYGVGFDNVDIVAAREFGIRVCNVPDYGADTVADHTVTLLLTMLRKVAEYDDAIRQRSWTKPSDLGSLRGFSQTTVGLLGTGRIGRAVAARLKPFGFMVIAHDPFVDAADLAQLGIRAVGLDELLSSVQALSLHAPLTDSNRHLLGKDSLLKMQPGAVIVNTARGGLIDEPELAEAVRSGRLGGAALDVFETEPLPADSKLRGLDKVILTPHVSFYSDESLANLQRLASEEADRALSNLPLRCAVV